MSDEFEGYDFSEFTADDFAVIDAHVDRVCAAGPTLHIAIEPDSPFRKFLSWKKHLAVTDLVSPVWCEVQHEYSLYGNRYKPLSQRPSTFTSRNGNRIRVHQQVAYANDRRLKRGKSVHKALEDELRPDKRVVHPTSDEERFALRLLGLIDGLNELVLNGITRELPVFTITHAQVVLGIIDEVLKSPLTRESQSQVTSPGSPSGSPPNKKPRLGETDPDPSPVSPVQIEPTSTCVPGDLYELRIVDYKTRRSSNLPLDQDSLSPRLQLMMYHRMLSCVLEPEIFDFDLMWSRLNLNPTKPFSMQFLKDIVWEQRQADPTDSNVHLNRLVSEWISTVQRNRSGLMGISQQLQIIYRRSVLMGKQREKGKQKATKMADVDDPLEALVLEEELNLARAIEESLHAIGHKEADRVAHRVAQSVMSVGPSSVGHTSAIWNDLISPPDAGQTDPMLAWAIQQSLLSCADEVCAKVPADTPVEDGGNPSLEQSSRHLDNPPSDKVYSPANQSTTDVSPIIGTKEFRMNDDELDTHLADVLRWWFGARPARGVEIGQTYRCFTCEYRDSCEWRAHKAREATEGKAQH